MSQPVVVLTITLTPATLNGCDGMACSVTADRPTTPRMIAHEALLVVAGIGDTHLRSMKDPLGRPG